MPYGAFPKNRIHDEWNLEDVHVFSKQHKARETEHRILDGIPLSKQPR
jgi:hypothetical protein